MDCSLAMGTLHDRLMRLQLESDAVRYRIFWVFQSALTYLGDCYLYCETSGFLGTYES